MNILRLLGVGLALSAISCSATTRVETFPADAEASIEVAGKPCKRGQEIRLPNTTFGSYPLRIKDSSGNVLLARPLPMRFLAWGLFWPPFGVFYNLYAVEPVCEIDLKPGKPSEERDPALAPPRNAAVKIWMKTAFDSLDAGMLSEAPFYLRLAMRVDPRYPDPALGLAIYHRQKGEMDKARELVEKYNSLREAWPRGSTPPRR